MNKRTFFPDMLMAVILLVVFSGCSGENSGEAGDSQNTIPEDKIIAKGKTAAQQTGGALMGVLVQKIQEEGVEAAIDFCAVRALPLTDSVSQATGVTISRVSHRPRNPVNAANEQEREILQRFAERLGQGAQPRPVVQKKQGGYLFYAPITIASETCLNCHGVLGKDIRPEVQEKIRSRYPEDQATGFHLNELRGMFKVEMAEEVVE